MPNTHEADVKAFMAAARMSDPEKYELVCSKYPVKSARQMRTIAETEIPVGLHPEAFAEIYQHRLMTAPALLEETA